MSPTSPRARVTRSPPSPAARATCCVTTRSKHAAQAKAFLNYQWSRAGQTIWAQQGYRPVDSAVARRFATRFPTPPQLFTIGYLGGWTEVADEFFAPSRGSITRLEQEGGFPTASS